MVYTNTGGVLVVDLRQNDFELREMSTIINNTANTWQADREIGEIRRDTTQGLKAEHILKQFFENHSDDFKYITYEEIREDNQKKNAPFDGLLMKKTVKKVVYEDCKTHILKDVSESEYGNITPETRMLCRACGIYTIEIKSSKINEKLMREITEQKGENDFTDKMAHALMQQRDIFIYPRFCRSSDVIDNYYSYASYVYNTWVEFNEIEFNHFIETKLPFLESEIASDIIILIYIEYSTVDGEKTMNRAYVMGYALSVDIATNKTIKRFYSEKSKKAIYMTLPLTKSRKMESMFYDSRLWGMK